MNISGNFDTKEKELKSVQDFLKTLRVDTAECRIEKFGIDKHGNDTNAKSIGDVYVRMPDFNTLLFEVKEEKKGRITRYNELGIDFISSFQFKKGVHADEWFHPHGPKDYKRFMECIDTKKIFKWGKSGYSKSDIWIFYCLNEDGSYYFLEGYDYRKLQDAHFFEYLRNNCNFVVNRKGKDQMSGTDHWMSATFFVNRNSLKAALVKNEAGLYHDGNFTKRAM